MSGLFANSRFAGFGPDPFRTSVESPPTDQISGRTRPEMRKLLRRHCPRLPGVYGMVDAHSRLIYVGKAKSLRHRLLSYFVKGSRHEKTGRIIDHTRLIVWEPGPCEFAALIRELELIRRWQPRYNVRGVPDRERQIYICLGRRPAPYVYVAREPTGQEVACFGPIKGVGMAREAARRLNDMFQLRDCSKAQTMHFADQRELFPILHTAGCLRYELGTCLGPCGAFTTRGTYGRHVRAAKAFLDSVNLSPLHKLESDMRDAAERLDFERAAALRDKARPIFWLRDRLLWLDQAREKHSCTYPQTCADGSTIWFLIRRGQVCGAIPPPADAASAHAAAEALARVFADDRGWDRLISEHLVDHVLLVASWFRKFPEEERAKLSPAAALARCAAVNSSLARPATEPAIRSRSA